MSVLHPTADEYKKIIGEKGLVMADFFATWCGPCKMLAPAVEQIAESYDGKVTVVKIDIDQETELTNSYGIMSVPTVLFIKDGKVISTEVGVRPIDYYTSIIEANI